MNTRHANKTAEQVVLGVALREGNSLGWIRSMVPSVDCFSIYKHQVIWNAIMSLADSGVWVEGSTVAGSLDSVALAQAGGAGYIAGLSQTQARMEAVEATCAALRSLWTRRRALQRLTEALLQAEDIETDIVETIGSIAGDLGTIARERDLGKGLISISSLAADYDPRVQPKREGLPTGFKGIDKALGGGLHPGRLYILAATPGQGKTSILIQLLSAAARGQGWGIALFFDRDDGRGNLASSSLSGV